MQLTNLTDCRNAIGDSLISVIFWLTYYMDQRCVWCSVNKVKQGAKRGLAARAVFTALSDSEESMYTAY